MNFFETIKKVFSREHYDLSWYDEPHFATPPAATVKESPVATPHSADVEKRRKTFDDRMAELSWLESPEFNQPAKTTIGPLIDFFGL